MSKQQEIADLALQTFNHVPYPHVDLPIYDGDELVFSVRFRFNGQEWVASLDDSLMHEIVHYFATKKNLS